MTNITVGDLRFLPYAGYADPALPDRVWALMLKAVGDASGGFNIAQINLKSAATPAGNIFSLEQLSLSDEDQTHTATRISTDGLESFGPSFLAQIWGVPMVATDEGLEVHMDLEHAHPKLWLGRGASAGPAATLTFRTGNTNLLDLDIYALGYMWFPRAINAPGGPRRPIGGAFSN